MATVRKRDTCEALQWIARMLGVNVNNSAKSKVLSANEHRAPSHPP
jgi:hypothetical protein